MTRNELITRPRLYSAARHTDAREQRLMDPSITKRPEEGKGRGETDRPHNTRHHGPGTHERVAGPMWANEGNEGRRTPPLKKRLSCAYESTAPLEGLGPVGLAV